MSRVYTNRICGINIENSIASKSKGLNATIGVFFDGTGNNLYNILHNQKTNNNKKGMYNPKTKKKDMTVIMLTLQMLYIYGRCMMKMIHLPARSI